MEVVSLEELVAVAALAELVAAALAAVELAAAGLPAAAVAVLLLAPRPCISCVSCWSCRGSTYSAGVQPGWSIDFSPLQHNVSQSDQLLVRLNKGLLCT